MKKLLHWIAVFLTFSAISSQLSTLHAQGTAFTYQGRLNDGANPATGKYDLTFALFNAASGAGQVGGTLTNTATGVTNGLFIVALDFGGVYDGTGYWLEIGVRTNGSGAFMTLGQRQKLTPTPYAVYAENVNAAGISGTVPGGSLGGVYGSPVTLNNAANNFTGNGSGLTGVNAATVGGQAAGSFWNTSGNSGTTAGVNFIGTTDNQALELRANNQTGLRLINNGSNAVNVVGGWSGNSVAADTVGAVIAGGGTGDYIGSSYTNQIGSSANFAAIGGGVGNTIQSNAQNATISGGGVNTIQSDAANSTIGGGNGNTIQSAAASATLGGGAGNTIQSFANCATLSGGFQNTIQSYVNGPMFYATIGGGAYNTIQLAAHYATLSGGYQNTIQSVAEGSTIGGGFTNTIRFNAVNATIGGGAFNTIESTAYYATIPGGINNTATNYAFAAGHHAKAVNTGAFVWADSTDADFASTADNQFAVRANGGMKLNLGSNNLEIASGGLKVTGAGVGTATPVFIHRAIAANISGNVTTITNSFCDGNPNAILIVTPNYNPGGTGGTYNNHPIGVYYNGANWTIFNQDIAAMPVNAAFNVLVVKP